MSFITKRERVFNEYDLFDLPARNEDKTEHLVEIIKRNNETVRPKYIPTDVIVNTLMTSKNAEIARLKRKIEEFEQMLAAYDQLELTCDQKCDIANAHAAIRAANKELDEMCLDLDFSGFTEGIDSETFETGKSRGDEPSRYSAETGKSRGDEWTMGVASTPKMETKSNQIGTMCKCDASTSAHDRRIDELQETIISKDAKLSAMQNTIAVMENDVCEPYCVYANIYTALEKIFGTLCQNGKYKQYLELLTMGKDTRGIDIKGKILFKIKVLEKFSIALIAPCSQDFSSAQHDCSCYHAEIVTHIETTFALTSAESKLPSLDDKRAQLIADIMQNDDIKEILTKDSISLKTEDNLIDVECDVDDNYSIDMENVNRLKTLQTNYDDLLNCYENLKHEKGILITRCQKYIELENECDCLKNKLREYNQLWKEKEYYRTRSEDLDALKSNYYVLSEETSNIESKLKAEQEINKAKSATVDELRNENIKLEKKISEVSLNFEKQRNVLICKLKECECKMMLQDQQIKSLQKQIDNLLGGEINKITTKEYDMQSMQLLDEIKSHQEQIKNLKDALCCNEEEKQYFQEEFERKDELINDLNLEIEEWKSKFEKTSEINNYLETYLEKFNLQVNELQADNKLLNEGIELKTSAIKNLNDILYSKSHEISSLIDEVDRIKDENQDLLKQVKSVHESLEYSKNSLESKKKLTLSFIRSAKKESLEILESVKNYDENCNINSNENVNSVLISDYQVRHDSTAENIYQDNDIDDADFPREIQSIHETNIKTMRILQNENIELKKSFDIANNENEKLKKIVLNNQNILDRFEKLTKSHEVLINEKDMLQCNLSNKTHELENVLHALQLTKKESENMIDQVNKSESLQKEYIKLNEAYHTIISEKNILQNTMVEYEIQLKEMRQFKKMLTEENKNLRLKTSELTKVENMLLDLNIKYDKLQEANILLQNEYDNQTDIMKNLYLNSDKKDEEIRELNNEIKNLKTVEQIMHNSIQGLKSENSNIQTELNGLNSEKSDLVNKLKVYEQFESNFNDLMLEKENIQNDLQTKIAQIKKLQEHNNNLHNESKIILTENEDLERALINARKENLSNSANLQIGYDDIKKQIHILQEEILSYNKKLRELRDKLDESDFIRSNLSEMIIAKDKKISTLENHINALEDEIRKLQCSLNKVIESGEQLKQLSDERLDQSFKLIEAHHSKATHNMKIDLEQLKTINADLKDKLSITELMSKESFKDNNKLITEIENLQTERETIISNIRQLEVQSLGDSDLLPKNCTVNEVIVSLDRINQYIEDKNIYIKNTMTNVQASYQLLQSKAEEAKKVAESERQKMITEKEIIQKERKSIQKELEDIRYDKENYEKMLKDLEGEMLNQNLIFNRVKRLHENDIIKLKEENRSLQGLYETSLNDSKTLQEKLDSVNNNYLFFTEKAKIAVEEKEKENVLLKEYIENMKCNGNEDFAAQANLPINNKDIACQSEVPDIVTKEIKDNNSLRIVTECSEVLPEQISSNEENTKCIELYKTKNVEPTFDLVKNMYISHKTRKLSLGKLEQYSITDSRDNNVFGTFNHIDTKKDFNPKSSTNLHNLHTLNDNENIIDIYSTQEFMDSNKNTFESNNLLSNNNTESLKSSIVDDVADSVYNQNNYLTQLKTYNKENNVADDSMPSTDKDIFLIYKDSQSINEDLIQNENKSKPQISFKKVIVETAIIHMKNDPFYAPNNRVQDINKLPRGKDNDDDSLKPTIEINLPRVFTELSSTTISNEEKKILDSHSSTRWVIRSESKINSEDSENSAKSRITSTLLEESSNYNSLNRRKTFSNHKIFKNTVEIKPFNRNQWSSDNNKSPDKKLTNSCLPIVHVQSNPKLTRVNAATAVLDKTENNTDEIKSNYRTSFITENVKNYFDMNDIKDLEIIKPLRKTHSDEKSAMIYEFSEIGKNNLFHISPAVSKSMSPDIKSQKQLKDRAILVKLDVVEDYEKKIQRLSDTFNNMEKEYKKKIKAIKNHYDSNIKHIINEHNQGVESIQNLHEETTREINKRHENEIENLRTMSIEAMRRAEMLESENFLLKSKMIFHTNSTLEEIPVKIQTPELKKKKENVRPERKTLTKSIIDAFNVNPMRQSHGPCTCSIDTNISDTIRNIFEQVDFEQRKMAEAAYLKYIANKILNDNVEILDAQELSFLHLKVCRTWKARLSKEGNLQKRIDSLESELMKKQHQTQKHMANLERQVAEEWRRLQEVREAVCRSSPAASRDVSPPSAIAEKDVCNCNSVSRSFVVQEQGPTENLNAKLSCVTKSKRGKLENNRAVFAKADNEARREKRFHSHEAPTRLKRSHDRQQLRTIRK